ncbi:MAG: hypothetical protein GX149_02605 [Acholeplasmataceae bacterium]|jgi:hypothetical protein|nr:hypothetical protein [Acholeplasmataceae bacterium]
MEAIIIVLNDLDFLDDLLEVFVKLNVKGATILDSYGMAKALRDSAKLSYLMKGPIDRAIPTEAEVSKTIFSVVAKESVNIITKTIRQVLDYSGKKAISYMFTIPVNVVL